MGVVSTVLLSAGVLRHYWDIYVHRTVRGISFIFVGIDAAGDVFSLISVCKFSTLCVRPCFTEDYIKSSNPSWIFWAWWSTPRSLSFGVGYSPVEDISTLFPGSARRWAIALRNNLMREGMGRKAISKRWKLKVFQMMLNCVKFRLQHLYFSRRHLFHDHLRGLTRAWGDERRDFNLPGSSSTLESITCQLYKMTGNSW